MLELREVAADELPTRLPPVLERVAATRASAREQSIADTRSLVEAMAERVADHAQLLDVVEGDHVAGVVWWGREGAEEATVYDVRLDDPARAPELLAVLLGRARAEGASRIGLGVQPNDPTRAALGGQPGFVSRATNMALALHGELPEADGVELRRMTEQEFATFSGVLVDQYATDVATSSGLTLEEARARSEEQVAGLIPLGLDSPAMEFFTAWHGKRPVGRLWLFSGDSMAFVYDVEVRAEERRKGYGASIMSAAARWSREHGHPSIGLNVFAHNPAARSLYDRLGYHVTMDYRTCDVGDA